MSTTDPNEPNNLPRDESTSSNAPQTPPVPPAPGTWPPPPPQQSAWPPQPPAQPGAWPPPPQTGFAAPGFSMPGAYTVPVNGKQILTLGILSFFCFGIILGPIAFIQGNKAVAAIDQGQADPSQRGLANAGRICGLIGGILSIIGIIVQIALRVNGTSGAF